jgi:hypothetical protein
VPITFQKQQRRGAMMASKQGQGHHGGREGGKKRINKHGIKANENRGRRRGGWDEDSSLAGLGTPPAPEAARKMPTMREENQHVMTSETNKDGSWSDKQLHSGEDLASSESESDSDALEEQELKRSRDVNNSLKIQVRNYKGDNQQLQKQVHKLKQDNQELNDRGKKLEEERQQYLQESVATEALVSETYNKVGKFAKDDLFHHKKFVNDDFDLNDITDEGSLGKQTMDLFNISESRRVAWWNTYKKAAADAIANQRSAVSSNIKRELKGKCNTVK